MIGMADLTATVITYNEEANIRACLDSLAWVKEIVVVDSGSRDRTTEICRAYTDKIVPHPWEGYIGQKNFAVSLASHDWVLSIDADERVPEELREAVQRELSAPRHDGYLVSRRNYFLGHWMRHGGWYPDRVLRLFDRRNGRFGGVNPHDRVVIANGSVGLLGADIVHLTYKDFSQYLRKQNRYTQIAADERVRRGRRPESIRGAELLLRALVKFVQAYVLKKGLLDGMHGLIAAVGASYFTFIKYAKIWEQGLRAGPDRRTDDRRTGWEEPRSRKTKISAVVITRDEEENIEECLESISWVDEIVVIDALSQDRTVEISRRFTDKVFLNPWPGFPAQRNFGLARATGDWILILDADERVSPEGREEIVDRIGRADREGLVVFRIPRKNYFFGRWLRWGGAFPDLQWRLFRRGFVRYDETTLDTPVIGGASAVMRVPLDHFTGRTVQERLRKLDAETSFLAPRTLSRRGRIGVRDVALRHLGTWLKVYILKQGFRDGLHGLVYAVLCGLHNFTRYVKAWEASRDPRCSV
jgi:glycosyltransferase involved in cell wall biosynthesis